MCSTRNLTNDRSWDAVISLDGAAGTRRTTGNAPLDRFLARLPGDDAHPAARRAPGTPGQSLAERAPPGGLGAARRSLGASSSTPWGSARSDQLPDFSGYRRLVVSPFVDADGLATLIARTTRRHGARRPTRAPRPARRRARRRRDRVLSVLAELEDDRAGRRAQRAARQDDDRRAGPSGAPVPRLRQRHPRCLRRQRRVPRRGRPRRHATTASTRTSPSTPGSAHCWRTTRPRRPSPTRTRRSASSWRTCCAALPSRPWTVSVTPQDSAFDLAVAPSTALPTSDARLTRRAADATGRSASTLTPGEPVDVDLHRRRTGRHHPVPGPHRGGRRPP